MKEYLVLLRNCSANDWSSGYFYKSKYTSLCQSISMEFGVLRCLLTTIYVTRLHRQLDNLLRQLNYGIISSFIFVMEY